MNPEPLPRAGRASQAPLVLALRAAEADARETVLDQWASWIGWLDKYVKTTGPPRSLRGVAADRQRRHSLTREQAVGVLRDALEDKESLVREHAAWALATLPNTRVDSQAR